MPSTTWTNLSDDKKERIVAASAAEFGAHGFSSGSLNVIARDAGVAKGSLFQYFDDKQDLFRYVYAELAATTRAEMESRLTVSLSTNVSIFGMLEGLIVEFVEYHREHPLEGAILKAMTFESDVDVRTMLREVVDRHYVELIAMVVQLAQADGQLRPGADTATLSATIHLLFMHLGVAGISPEMNPFVPLHELEGSELRTAMAAFVKPVESYYVNPDWTPSTD